MAAIPNPRAFDCTPSSLLASVPCLSCLSETELLATMVAIIALATDKNISDILKESACFTCMSDKQMEQGIVTILGNDLLGESFSEAELLDDMKCIRQCSNAKQLKAALLYLLCNDIKFAQRIVVL